MSNTEIGNTIVITQEDLSKVITAAILGFVCGVLNQHMPLSPKDLYETTLNSIKTENLQEEFIQMYDEVNSEIENMDKEE